MPAAHASVNDSHATSGATLIGQQLGQYQIIAKIGEGGMGEVYAAVNANLGKRVALKIVSRDVIGSRDAIERFRKEAQSASAISHDNVINVYDYGELPDGRAYMVMDLLEGAPLDKVLSSGPLAAQRAFDLLIKVCRGLIAIHAKGIVHRDLKPANIFVISRDDGDVPKILDFGIAKASDGHRRTAAGTMFGTPLYMAPEQAMGTASDPRTDIYAMGVILYEIFTGTVPFNGEHPLAILQQQVAQPPVPPSVTARRSNRAIPEALEAVILRCLEKQPGKRYQSMTELVDALAQCSGLWPARRRHTARRRAAVALAVGGTIAIAATAMVAAGEDPRPPIFLRVVAEDSTPLHGQLRTAVERMLARHPAVSLDPAPAGSSSFTMSVGIEADAAAGESPTTAAGPAEARVVFKLAVTGARTDLGSATLVIRNPGTPFKSTAERDTSIVGAVESSDVTRFVDETLIAHRIMRSGDLTTCFADSSVQLALEIDADGRAVNASATPREGTTTAEAKACLDAAARSWRFHRPAHPLKVAFTRTL